MNLKIKQALAVAGLALVGSAAHAAIPAGEIVFDVWNANTATQGFTLDTGLNLSSWNPATSFSVTITNAAVLASFNTDLAGTAWNVTGASGTNYYTSVDPTLTASQLGVGAGDSTSGILGARSYMGTAYGFLTSNTASNGPTNWAATMSQGNGNLGEVTDSILVTNTDKLGFAAINSAGNASLYSGFWSLSFLNATGGAATQGTATQAVLSWTSSATAVPLPAAVWLLGSGLAGLAGVGRRRQKTEA